MKKKTVQSQAFITELHKFIVRHPQFRDKTSTKSEVQIQTEIRPLILRYLENYFTPKYKDAIAKAHKSFYWEGQEQGLKKARKTTFGSRNYPDFIIKAPYKVAVEYKQSPNGSAVKQGIGQSIIHTLSKDFDFVYYLFHDQSKDDRIRKSASRKPEKAIIDRMWHEFNVLIKFV